MNGQVQNAKGPGINVVKIQKNGSKVNINVNNNLKNNG